MANLPGLLIEVLDSPPGDILDEIGRFRVEVWEAEKRNIKFSARTWLDRIDPLAIHWCVRTEKGQLIASARLSVHETLLQAPDIEAHADLLSELPTPIASINRLVVSPTHRGQGIGRKLDEARIDNARARGAKSVVARAVPWRVESLRKLGFREVQVVPTHYQQYGFKVIHLMMVDLTSS